MRAFAFLVLGALLVGGCGSGSGLGARPKESVGVADGSYEVGKDIEAGVYTAAVNCLGTIASTPDYSSMDSGPDTFRGGSVQVGGQQRVALKTGEFFISEECPDGWHREGSDRPRSPDPATVKGGCAILVANGVMDDALSIARDPAEFGGRRSSEVQDELFAIVVSENKALYASAGQLVDLLDDPASYREPNGFIAKIDRAAARIRQVCGKA